jgi:hypothetical protein
MAKLGKRQREALRNGAAPKNRAEIQLGTPMRLRLHGEPLVVETSIGHDPDKIHPDQAGRRQCDQTVCLIQ